MQSKIVLFLVFIFYSILIYRVYDLSIVSFKKYSELSKENYTKTIPIAPVRGIIFDRKNTPIAINELRFNLTLKPHLKDKELNSTLKNIAEVMDVNATKLYKIYKKQDSIYSNKDVVVLRYLTK